jgi:hypothetical protein
VFAAHWRKNWSTMTDRFQENLDSVRREVLYNILIEFGVPMKLIRLIKMCLNEIYSKVPLSKHLSNVFHIQNGLKKGDALLILLYNTPLGRSKKSNPDGTEIKRDTSASGLC